MNLLTRLFALHFDRSFSGKGWRQLAWLFGVIVTVFLLIYLVSFAFIFPEPSLEEWTGIDKDVPMGRLLQLICVFIDPGNIVEVPPYLRWFSLLVVVLGLILFCGLLISVISNMLERRIERYREGDIVYPLQNHIVIIGFDNMVPTLIQQICDDTHYGNCHILIQSTQPAQEIRSKIHTELDAKNENGFHHTTAADLSLIMRYCIKTSEMAEQFLTITREGQYQFSDIDGKNSYTCCNHNAFLQLMDGALSGKTGFTGNAGYCYVGALKRDDRTFIVALLACGWPNNKTYKWADTKKLMQYGISRFRKISLDEIELDAGEYAPVQVVDGQGTKIGEEVTTELEVAPVKENVELLIEKDQEVHIEYQLSRKLYAPVTEGDFIGEITYLLGDEVLAKRVVTVKNTVKRIDFCWCVKKTAELFPM